jgi:hypothetical protein
MPYEVDQHGVLRQTSAPPDYDKARTEHAGELKNFAGQWNLKPWPPTYLTPDGKISGYDLLQIQRQIASFTDHERSRIDRARFFYLLKLCGYEKEYSE